MDVEQLPFVERLRLAKVVRLRLDHVTLDVHVDHVAELVELTFGNHDGLLKSQSMERSVVGRMTCRVTSAQFSRMTCRVTSAQLSQHGEINK